MAEQRRVMLECFDNLVDFSPHGINQFGLATANTLGQGDDTDAAAQMPVIVNDRKANGRHFVDDQIIHRDIAMLVVVFDVLRYPTTY